MTNQRFLRRGIRLSTVVLTDEDDENSKGMQGTINYYEAGTRASSSAWHTEGVPMDTCLMNE